MNVRTVALLSNIIAQSITKLNEPELRYYSNHAQNGDLVPAAHPKQYRAVKSY